MGRARRIEAPGGIYHLGSRGNRGCPIYVDDGERETFLRMLGRLSKRHGWSLGTYCLMTNHYHLLITIESGLSDGMRELNGGFSSYTNAKNDLEGHLFKNRFWYEPIESDAHLLETLRYIVLNPVRAGICASPEEWRWSSYRSLAGTDFAPPFLAANDVLRLFGDSPPKAREAYREFVSEGIERAAARATSRCQTPSRNRNA
jgi:REP element-mobilizing transposase RayT